MNDTPTDATTEPGPAPASGPGSAPRPEAGRRLTRSRDDRVLGGVAAGVARYFAIDPVIVRAGFVVGTVLAGVGVLAYVAGWLLIPDDDSAATGRGANVRQLAGYVVLGIGLAMLLGAGDFWFDGQMVWALGLIAIGTAVLWLRGRDTRAVTDTPVAAPPAAGPPPRPPAAFSPTEGATAPPRPSAPSPYDPTAPSAVWDVPTPPRPPAPPGVPAKPRRPPSLLGPLTLCVLLLLGGVAAAVSAAGADVNAGVLLGLALAVLGTALVVGAWWGRARWLVAPGIALALVATLFGVLDVPLSSGIGERDYRPTTVGLVEDDYELGIGSLELDLRALDFSGRSETVRASVGIGELKVWVPDDVRVVIDEHVGIGELVAFGEHDDGGVDVDTRLVRRGVEGGGTLRLDLDGGFGSVKVLDADDGGPS